MGVKMEEGESITLPCRHCASLSLNLRVQVAVLVVHCTKCGEGTTVTMAHADREWTFKTSPVHRTGEEDGMIGPDPGEGHPE